jgi:hypothetical protein
LKYVKLTFECSKRRYQPHISSILRIGRYRPKSPPIKKILTAALLPTCLPRRSWRQDQRKQIVSQLLLLVKEGGPEQKLVRGTLTDVAKNFNVTAQTVRMFWKRARQSFADPAIEAFRASPLKKNFGPKQKYNRDEVREAILLVPLHKRKTLRKLASSLGIPTSTVHRMKTDPLDNVIVPHSNVIKRRLHHYHLAARVFYTASNLDLEDSHYHGSFNLVHIDEKCFFLTEKQLHLYHLVPGKAVPYRSTRHKSHIFKVMFLAAVARPEFNTAGICTFGGGTYATLYFYWQHQPGIGT